MGLVRWPRLGVRRRSAAIKPSVSLAGPESQHRAVLSQFHAKHQGAPYVFSVVLLAYCEKGCHPEPAKTARDLPVGNWVTQLRATGRFGVDSIPFAQARHRFREGLTRLLHIVAGALFAWRNLHQGGPSPSARARDDTLCCVNAKKANRFCEAPKVMTSLDLKQSICWSCR